MTTFCVTDEGILRKQSKIQYRDNTYQQADEKNKANKLLLNCWLKQDELSDHWCHLLHHGVCSDVGGMFTQQQTR